MIEEGICRIVRPSGALDELSGEAAAGTHFALDQHVAGIGSAHFVGQRSRDEIAHASGWKARNDERVASELGDGALDSGQRCAGRGQARNDTPSADHGSSRFVNLMAPQSTAGVGRGTWTNRERVCKIPASSDRRHGQLAASGSLSGSPA
jgi:hypothetical protein